MGQVNLGDQRFFRHLERHLGRGVNDTLKHFKSHLNSGVIRIKELHVYESCKSQKYSYNYN